MMRARWGLLAGTCLLAACSGRVEFREDEWVLRGRFAALADRRIFAVMAFLNAAGYDEEFPGCAMHPVRLRVRELVSRNLEDCPEKVRDWKMWYGNHRSGAFAWKSFALALSPEFPFRRVVPDEKLAYPWTAQALGDLPPILNHFWISARLDEVWAEVKPAYIAEVRRYDLEKMEREMAFLWSYLRMPRPDAGILVLVPDLLDHNTGSMAAGYGDHYYSVENQGSGSYSLPVHEYLHSVVNALVEANHAGQQAKLDAWYEAGKDRPACATYREPATFAFECLVRALDYRIRAKIEGDPRWTDFCERHVASDTAEGLLLTAPFHGLLDGYERSGVPFDRYVPVLLERLPVRSPAVGPDGCP